MVFEAKTSSPVTFDKYLISSLTKGSLMTWKKNGPRDTVTPDAVRAFLGFMGPCQVWKEYIPLLITLQSFWEVDSTFIQLILSIYFLTSLNFPPKKGTWCLRKLLKSSPLAKILKKSLKTKILWTPKCQGTEEFQIPPSLGIQHLVPKIRHKKSVRKIPAKANFQQITGSFDFS